MVKGKDCQLFVKKFDRYANSISLAYNNKTQMDTVIGGVCTIITFSFLAYVLVINIIKTFAGINFSVDRTYDLSDSMIHHTIPLEDLIVTN